MRPKPFKPEIYNNDEKYVRYLTTGFVWHRSQNRTLYADTDRSEVVYHSNY
jgi:acyl-CoA thioester hydrolase